MTQNVNELKQNLWLNQMNLWIVNEMIEFLETKINQQEMLESLRTSITLLELRLRENEWVWTESKR